MMAMDHARALDNAEPRDWRDDRKFYGIGCRVGIASLGGERGEVTALPLWGTTIELASGEKITVPDAEIWRQDDPSRPWGHDGWIPYCYTCMTWSAIDRAVAIAGIELPSTRGDREWWP